MQDTSAMQRFTDNVARIMTDQGITVTGLASSSGIGRPGLSRILNGHEGITLERAEKIAEALGVELSELIAKEAVPI